MKHILSQNQEIHLWKLSLDKWKFKSVYFHSQDKEIAEKRFSNFYLQKKHLVKTTAIRNILSLYMGKEAQNNFSFTDKGKPYFSYSHWHFNYSDTDSILLLGIAKEIPLGVDIEKIKNNFEAESMAEIIMHEDELLTFKKIPCFQKKENFFELWVKKEAYGKLLGIGLSEDPRKWSIGFSETRRSFDPLVSFSLFKWSDYRAAVAYRSPIDLPLHIFEN